MREHYRIEYSIIYQIEVIYCYMKYSKNKFILLLGFAFFLSKQISFSQYSSKEKNKGDWESASTWNPVWPNPQTFVNGINININGYVTVNGSLTFSGANGNLVINDTLVIKGDLTLGDHNDLQINNTGVLIVWGNLTVTRRADVAANGYLIVTNDVIKNGQYAEGSISSNQNPAKVFVGGVIPSALTNGNTNYPALDCTKQNVYPNSGCSYGNLYDLANTPVFNFYRSTCTITTPTVSTSGPSTFCPGGNVTLTSSAGTSYLWSDGSVSKSITVLTSGSYFVRVTDSKLCLSAPSETVMVNVLPTPSKPVVTPAGPVELCPGEFTTLTTGTASAYAWTNGESTQSIQVNSTGTYRVKVTGVNGCVSEYSDTVMVTVNQTPPAPTVSASGPLTFCAGDSVELTSSDGFSYLWSTGATTKSIKVEETGSYSVTIKNIYGCQSSASALQQVNVLSKPEKPILTPSGPLSFCSGDSVILTSSLSNAYQWTNGAATRMITVKSPGDFKVKVTDLHGCISELSEAITVVVKPIPGKPQVTASGSLTFCSGDSVTLISEVAAGYLWSTGDTTKSIKVLLPGFYSVKITGVNGCESNFSEMLQVVVNPKPNKPVITSSGPLTICSGSSVTLSAGAAAGYIWSTGENTPQITISTSGNYSVNVKNSAGCLSEPSDVATVVVNQLPEVTIASPGTMCINSTMELNGTPAGGTFRVLKGSATIQNNKLTPSSPGNILIEYTYSGICTNAATKNIIVSGLPLVNAGPDQILQSKYETKMQAELFPSETGEWKLISGKGQIRDIHSPQSEISGLGEGKNVFQWKVSAGECVASDEVTLTVEGLFIPSVITPNGDGQNDFFHINPAYGKLKLIIFNHRGNVEYSSDNYLNNWDGRNNKGLFLPDDTYYYVLHFENGIIKKGSILIMRK